MMVPQMGNPDEFRTTGCAAIEGDAIGVIQRNVKDEAGAPRLTLGPTPLRFAADDDERGAGQGRHQARRRHRLRMTRRT